MGLDITAYKNIELNLDQNFDWESDDRYRDYFKAYVNPHFPKQGVGIIDSAIYVFDDITGMRAGSYTSYNDWREELAEFAGYKSELYQQIHGIAESCKLSFALGAESETGGLFHELIVFSDCEGVINAEVSKKLYNDFVECDAEAKEFSDGYFYAKYCEWKKCFEFASHSGCVVFM